MPFAKILDPTLPAWGSIEKDPVEAWNYYGKAQDAQAQAALKAWAEKAAQGGDAQARSALQAFK